MQMSVRAIRPWAFLTTLVLAFFASPLSAQEAGNIQGRVTDAASGAPIIGAQVTIVGTRLGNITNNDGYYFINNVPAGLQDIQAEYLGYQTVAVRQQRVLAGQRLTQNFALPQAAVVIEALEVVGEQRPLVPRDQVASKNIITGETISELPVTDVTQVVRLQPGVVATGNKNGFSIRGGRSGEEAVYIDGVLSRNFNTGQSNITVGVNSLSEVDVLTGGFSAEYGEAQSGIINYVTRTGGSRWSGAASFQTDEIAPKEWSRGLNRGELSLGGPLFGNFSFFGSAAAEGRKSAEFGSGWRNVPIYVQQGIDTVVTYSSADGSVREVAIPEFVRYDEGGRIPFSNSDVYTADGRLDFSYGSGSRVFLTGKFSRNQSRSTAGFGGGIADFYNPNGYSGQRFKSNAYILGWTHNLVRSAESALALDFKVARTTDRVNSGILDRDWDLNNRDPSFGFTRSDMEFVVDEDNFPVNDDLIRAIRTNDTDRAGPFGIGRNDLLNSQEFRLNPYAEFTTFNTAGLGGTFGYLEEKQWQFRGAVDWQVNRANRLRFGADHILIDVKNASIGYTSAFGAQAFIESPKRSSLFVQDRLDVGDMVVEAGLRYDRFDPNSEYPLFPGYFQTDTLGNPANDPAGNPTFADAPIRSRLSPRLGVSFPVTVNSTFRLSYGHFTQVPDLNEFYSRKNANFLVHGNQNSNITFGRPLDLGRTIAFEFGFRQLLSPDFVLDISAYNRDKQSDVAARQIIVDDPTNPGVPQKLNIFTNADFGNIRGIDARLDRRFGRIFDAMLGYSYQDARNTGTDPFSYINVFSRLESNANQLLGTVPTPAEAMRITEENRKHNLTGNFAFHFPSDYDNKWLANFGLSGTLRFASGTPYTRLEASGDFLLTNNQGLGTTGAVLADDELNTAELPWLKIFDLQARKGINLMGARANLFVIVNNVLDLENITGVYATSGDIREERVFAQRVESARAILGGNAIRESIDLTSLATAGAGITNPVDLVAVRRAEERFGNGNGLFTADEQEAAIRAALNLTAGPQNFIGAGRRMNFGIEINF
jgi:outer membrane receptor protein involved in Fe transport